jgi:tetratricopeptide (TPR) repeat protein
MRSFSRRFVVSLFLLACGHAAFRSLAADPQAGCREAAAQIKEGEALLARKQSARAAETFRSALAACPESSAATLGLIQAYLGARQFNDAARIAQELLARDPRSEAAQLLLAQSYFMQERFQEAGKVLQRLLAQNDANGDAHKLMGLTLFFYQEDSMAERELQTTLRLRPNDDEALYYLGRVYYTQNNFPPAVDAFRRLISKNRRSYKAYDNLGLCYAATGKVEEAVAAFKAAQALASELDPAYDWPYGNLAELLLKQGRFREALSYAQQAERLNPRSARNEYLMGKALARLSEPDAAISHLRRSADLDPGYPEPHYLLGQLYGKLGRPGDADREFALFATLSKNTPHVRR